MSKKKKNQIEDLELQTQEKPKMHFSFWFDKKLSEGEVRFYQDEALLVYFKKQGLTENEDESSYDRAFETF